MWRDHVEDLLSREIGLDHAAVGDGTISKAVETRRAARGFASAEEYVAALQGSGEELQALIEEVVIPESWFFRDVQPFELVRRLARERWLRNPSFPPLRALSLPCASGEEPYSIALTLNEAGLPASRFQIDGVDVSARVLDRARRGVYSENAFRAKAFPDYRRHFRPVANRFELDPAVRASVRFHRGNLLDAGLLKGEAPYDFIFFRNLLIYLTPEARERAMATLDRLLAPTGILFAGHAEALAILTPRFAPIPERGCFAYRRVSASPTPPEPAPSHPPVSRPHRPRDIRQDSAARPKVLSRADPGHGTSGLEAAQAPNTPTPGLLERATECANQRRYDEAIRLCEQSNRERGPSAQAYFLLGMIHQAAGRADQADACLLKAVYLDAQHDEALLALALNAQRRGDPSAEAGYRRRAERASQRKGAR